jgi:pyruvate/2-oxoacid:ferredoxin oxidoreductase beta subunit
VPTNLIRHFIRSKKKVNVLEQGSDYGLKLVKQALEESEYNIHSDTGVIPNNDDSYINFAGLEKLFKALKSTSPKFVVGDLSQFTNETTKTIQACLCMGASVPIAMGLSEAGIRYPFCITGDASLAHAGIGIINEVLARSMSIGIIIIDNGGSVSTGGQSSPSGLSNLDCLSQKHIIKIDYNKTSTKEFETLFQSMEESGETKIVRVITD